MKYSKRLIRILDSAQQPDLPITCSAFFGSYLKEDGIIQKEVTHYLLQSNSENALLDALDKLDKELKVTIYNGYLLSENLIEAIEFGAARARKYNQIIMSEAHVLEGILSSLPDARTWQDILQLVSTTQDLIVTLPIPRMPLISETDVETASLSNEDEIIEFVKEHFGWRWSEQVQRMLLEDECVVFIVRKKNQLSGFCCYRKQSEDCAVFGPMGVRKDCRDSGFGRSLLLVALHDVSEQGFREFIISEAGPIEFYERILPLKIKEKG
ncbi:hypothetical protein CHH91_07830 [Virgibacillus sp. 7505]|uniref:GNAT family N-acetyltransferase n=1 Tax=Virgibacillus sp. 7505 TaxID=2022548 RepID=UPI000BA54A76|nr:GNAT family N-acetyltransferase [Virgibacillus sp. 7505]PAE16562.1 hypothetical protein CHH91_07830 [Virgibacillus sp. 7505]